MTFPTAQFRVRAIREGISLRDAADRMVKGRLTSTLHGSAKLWRLDPRRSPTSDGALTLRMARRRIASDAPDATSGAPEPAAIAKSLIGTCRLSRHRPATRNICG